MSNRYKLGLRGKTTLVLSGLICLVLIVTSFASYWQSKSVAEQKVIEFEQSKFSLLKYEIEGVLRNHHQNLLTLHDVSPIQAIVRARANNGIDPESEDTLQQWKSRLITTFKAILEHYPEYQQVSYIDAAGDELIRVQADANGDVKVVADTELQNKSGSDYVSQTLPLKEGEVYSSDVTLNREHGIIQVPHLPVFRLATPVRSADGQVAALIMIKLATERLFSGVRSEANGVQRNIVDGQGYYIKYTDAAKTFGLERGIDYRFQTVESELAEIASRQDHFMRHDDNHNELDGFQKIYFSPQDHSRYWLLTLNAPERVVFAETAAALNKMLLISLLLGLISLLFIVWFITKKVVTPVVELAAAASRLQAGDLTVRVDATSARDEFHTLYLAINAFANNQQQATTLLENQVTAQTKRLSAVIDNVVDGIITIGERGTIESFNPAARQIFGYSDAEVIGQNVKMLMPEPYHSEHDGYLEHHITTGEKRVIGIGREVTGRRKDGTTFPMELAVSEVVIDNNRNFVGIIRDITERKRNEQMQKEFISTVSHELRTPLTSIRGSLGLILGGVTGELSDKTRALLTIANNNSERLIHLINDILDLDKISAGKMQFKNKVVNLVSVVTQAIDSNKGYGDQFGVTFNLITNPDEIIIVRIDEKRMAQVMSNLFSNAAKYSPKNGQVKISIQTQDNRVCISVHDDGKGIPEEFKSRIFNKFAQADSSDTRQKGGTGLGLNITKAIIENMRGNISFESAAGQGTTFHIELPLWDNKFKPAIPNSGEHKQTSTSNAPLLLIVEDDQDVSKLLSIMVEKEGYRYHQAFSYPEAVAQIKNHHYDAITLDLMIPGGSGLTLLQELRENEATHNLPIIVISAKAKEGQLEVEETAFSMVDWIEKPIDEKRLLESIRSNIFRTKTENRRILHVEDDVDIAIIIDTLLNDEYQIVHAATLQQAKERMGQENFDLVLLDIGLPDGSGLDLLPLVNTLGHQTPVIIFSAQDTPPAITSQVRSVLIKSQTDNKKIMQQIKSAITYEAP